MGRCGFQAPTVTSLPPLACMGRGLPQRQEQDPALRVLLDGSSGLFQLPLWAIDHFLTSTESPPAWGWGPGLLLTLV